MHAILIGHYDASYEACARQDAVVEAMRDSTDRGPGDDVDHVATRAQLDEQAAVAHALHLAELAAAVARVPGGDSLRAVQAAGAAPPTHGLRRELIDRGNGT